LPPDYYQDQIMPAGTKRWLTGILLCVIAMPLLIYMVGTILVGPYEGEFGLLGLIGSLYGDALTGTPSAWLVLLSPCLLILIWMLSMRIGRLVAR
jgi:hypothetical protein